jgi:hypothetical protein
MQLSFETAYKFMKKVDMLRGGPKWEYRNITVKGDKVDENGQPLTEDCEVWLRDPVECIAELISNPAFKHCMSYVPERVYVDSMGKSRRYDEMWTADWWWDVQVSFYRPTATTVLTMTVGKNQTWRCCLPSDPFH